MSFYLSARIIFEKIYCTKPGSYVVGFVYKVIKIIYILDPVMKITVKVVKYAFCMVKECAWVLNMQMLDSPH